MPEWCCALGCKRCKEVVVDDASEWEPYTPEKPVTLEELLDYLTEQDMVESNSLQFGGDIPVKELLRRMGR